jgi:tetraacyldisaccharide 4'-kinase
VKQVLKTILYPFSVLYDAVTSVRNFLYDKEISHSESFDVPIICVGNLRVGGTGKTPHVEYLIRLLKDRKKVVTLSRGYGRQTRGFMLAGPKTTAAAIGDEPMQFYLKYGKEVTVAVGEKRVPAIHHLIKIKPATEVIILDDAFQHRAVRPRLNIMLSDYNKPFYEDLLLPAGRLREKRRGASRADIVIITKCPSRLSDTEKFFINKNVARYTKTGTPVFFTSIYYMEPQPLPGCGDSFNTNVILFSGLANPEPLKQYIKSRYKLLYSFDYQDHHLYTPADIAKIKAFYHQHRGEAVSLLTTEKDMVKLLRPELREELEGLPLFYLPIEIAFLDGKEKFEQIIFDCLAEKQSFYS